VKYLEKKIKLIIKHLGKKKFKAKIRSHHIIIDQNKKEGGTDEGMNPVELLNTSIASCAAFYAISFLNHRNKDFKGLDVECNWEIFENPHRVGKIDLKIILPHDLKVIEKKALLRSVEHCTLKNTLEHPPEIQFNIKEKTDK
jgi:uncharacterized OsmC-like protein